MVGVVTNTGKIAIAGGALYSTGQQGAWSTTSEVSWVFENVRRTIFPATTSECVGKIPSL